MYLIGYWIKDVWRMRFLTRVSPWQVESCIVVIVITGSYFFTKFWSKSDMFSLAWNITTDQNNLVLSQMFFNFLYRRLWLFVKNNMFCPKIFPDYCENQKADRQVRWWKQVYNWRNVSKCEGTTSTSLAFGFFFISFMHSHVIMEVTSHPTHGINYLMNGILIL